MRVIQSMCFGDESDLFGKEKDDSGKKLMLRRKNIGCYPGLHGFMLNLKEFIPL